jgi:hypothetical protein
MRYLIGRAELTAYEIHHRENNAATWPPRRFVNRLSILLETSSPNVIVFSLPGSLERLENSMRRQETFTLLGGVAGGDLPSCFGYSAAQACGGRRRGSDAALVKFDHPDWHNGFEHDSEEAARVRVRARTKLIFPIGGAIRTAS